MAISIIQQPQALTLVGVIPDIIVETTGLGMVLNLKIGSTVILSEYYVADAAGRARVNLRDFIDNQLHVDLPGDVNLYEQTRSWRTFTVEITVGVETEEFSFIALKGGSSKLTLDCAAFLRDAWLTWQTQTKRVRDTDPEWISYYAQSAALVKCRAYFSGGTSETITLHTLEAGKHYTINATFSDIREEFELQPIYFDLWVENSGGTAFSTWQMRYVLTTEEFDYPDLFLFKNGLGGIDTIRFTGEKRSVNPMEVGAALFFDEYERDYLVTPRLAFEKNTGYFPSREAMLWAQDFFLNKERFILEEEELIPIRLISPETLTQDHVLVAYEFTYGYTRQTPYLALFKKKNPLIDPIIIGPGDEEFYLPPVISEFPQETNPEGLLFPVQQPGTPGWSFVTWETLLETILAEVGTGGGAGTPGEKGWSPILAVVTDGARRVHQVADWTGGEGAKPATGQYLGASGLVTDIADAVSVRGPSGIDGEDGLNGWAPILSVVSDGERRVHRVVDWTGGTGDKPATGQYLGATGFVTDITEAVDIRGAQGEAGSGGTSLNTDIVDALEASTLPSAENPFATKDDIPIVPEDFIDLSDTPNAYTGQGGKKVKVKADETGLEFVDDTGGGGRDADAVHYDAADGKTQSEQEQARINIGLTNVAPQFISTSGLISDLAPTSRFIVFTGANPILDGIDVTGLRPGTEIFLYHLGSGTLTLRLWNNSASATANRFRGVDILPVGGSQILRYLTGTYGWHLVGNTLHRVIDTADIARESPTVIGNSNSTGIPIGVSLGVKARPGTGGSQRFFAAVDVSNVERYSVGNDGAHRFSGVLWVNGFAASGSNYHGIRVPVTTGTLGALALENPSVVWQLFCDGRMQHPRSNGSVQSLRRDEQLLLYPITVTTAGTINDLPETAGNFNYYLTAATRLNGMAGGENGKERIIQNDNTVDLVIAHQDTGSIAANRFNLIGAVNLTVPAGGIAIFTYKTTISRWVLKSKNF